jgi:hypothetical protein
MRTTAHTRCCDDVSWSAVSGRSSVTSLDGAPIQAVWRCTMQCFWWSDCRSSSGGKEEKRIAGE